MSAGAGPLLRSWRERRSLSQLALASGVGMSTRHLSFIETGRSRPSPQMLLAVSEYLRVPLRERNALLLAGGYAPRFSETDLSAPALAHVRASLQRLLDAHDPFPGIALDRAWNVVLYNTAAKQLIAALPQELAAPPLNMFRASLHPRGFAAHTLNFDAWGPYLLRELRRLVEATADPTLEALEREVRAYDNVAALIARALAKDEAAQDLVLPCDMQLGDAKLSFFTTLATIGSPLDVTLSELTLELFYPADAETERLFARR